MSIGATFFMKIMSLEREMIRDWKKAVFLTYYKNKILLQWHFIHFHHDDFPDLYVLSLKRWNLRTDTGHPIIPKLMFVQYQFYLYPAASLSPESKILFRNSDALTTIHKNIYLKRYPSQTIPNTSSTYLGYDLTVDFVGKTYPVWWHHSPC